MGREVEPMFELHLEAPATPRCVQSTAQLLDRVLCDGAADGGVTMEVRNYHTKALVRPRSRAGRTAAARFVRFVDDPVKTARTCKAAAPQVAAALLDAEALLLQWNSKVVRCKDGKTLPLDRPFFQAIAGLSATQSGEPQMTGQAEEYTPILRVGRLSEGDREMRARILLGGKAADVPFAPELKAQLFELAREERTARVLLDCAWHWSSELGYELDPRRCRILEAEPCDLLTGAEFLATIEAAGRKDGPIFEGSAEDIISAAEEW